MNKITDTKQLSYQCYIDGITRLSVRDNLFGVDGCQHIQSHCFRNLQHLNLGKNKI